MAPVPTTARGRRTRSALIHAAREMFEEVGFRDARISDIAERAGTSYGVFYHYFKSKEAILGELFTTVTGEMFTASRPSPDVPPDPLSRIEDANRKYLKVARRNARLIAVIEEMAIRDPWFSELKLQIREPFLQRNEAGIRSLQKRGLADPAVDAALAATMLGGMVEHFGLMWFVHGVPCDEDAAVATLTRLWAQAIGLRDEQRSEPSQLTDPGVPSDE
ncbi:TetR/AcrR family transcriptional regulator [Streptomyces libani]|nr:TetR/AcrR family transcriptional regulator [Streptomyces sp. ID38640]